MPRLLALLAALGVAVPAAARGDDFDSAGGTRFEVDKERPTRDKLLIASLGAAALVVGGVGVLFHRDANAKSDAVSNGGGRNQGRVYTPEVDDTRRAALRSRAITIGAYAASGALVVATFVAYLVTDPGTEIIELDDGHAARPLAIEPVAGGAIIGGGWRF